MKRTIWIKSTFKYVKFPACLNNFRIRLYPVRFYDNLFLQNRRQKPSKWLWKYMIGIEKNWIRPDNMFFMAKCTKIQRRKNVFKANSLNLMYMYKGILNFWLYVKHKFIRRTRNIWTSSLLWKTCPR